MNERSQNQIFETVPQQLAFGQNSRARVSPEEAAAEHWQEVYRLTKELRQRPKRRSRQAWSRQRARDRNPQHEPRSGQREGQQNRQQNLLPEQPALPELEFTRPQMTNLVAMNEPDMRPHRFSALRLTEPAGNQQRYAEVSSPSHSSGAGRAICRHLIAALRIQHAEEQQKERQ